MTESSGASSIETHKFASRNDIVQTSLEPTSTLPRTSSLDLENEFSQLVIEETSSSEEDSSSSLDDDDDDDNEETAERVFDPTICLFCNQHTTNLAENIEHMQKTHGLFIPSTEDLIVDIETLIDYLHLVIFEYNECLYCGSMRTSSQAAQQHMLGKSHCRIDLAREGSEYRDFYNFALGDGEEGKQFVDIGDNTRRLASGKVLSHRSNKQTHTRRSVLHGKEGNADDLLLNEGESAAAGASTSVLDTRRSSKKEVVAAKRELLFSKQLASLRGADRQALSHLTLPQQKAAVVKAKAQQERWNKKSIALQIKRQVKANP